VFFLKRRNPRLLLGFERVLPKPSIHCHLIKLGSHKDDSTKLGSPDGGKKTKVVLFGSVEGSSGLASCPTITDASIFVL
jgi:hypothetical protein